MAPRESYVHYIVQAQAQPRPQCAAPQSVPAAMASATGETESQWGQSMMGSILDPTSSESEAEAAPEADGQCDTCARDRQCLNPLRFINLILKRTGQRGPKSRAKRNRKQPKYLPFVRPNVAECCHCRNAMAEAFKGEPKAKLKAKVKQGGEFAKTFKRTVLKWERRKIMAALPPKTSLEDILNEGETLDDFLGTPSDDDDASDGSVDEQPETVVEGMSSSMMESRQLVGHFWPSEVYSKFVEEDPPEDKVTTFTHQGQKLKGVWRDPSLGAPFGVHVVTSIGLTGGNQRTLLDSSKSELRKGQTQELFKKIQARNQVTSQYSKKEDGTDEVDKTLPINVKVTTPAKKKKGAQDGCLLDDLWQDGFGGCGDDGVQNSKTKSKERASSDQAEGSPGVGSISGAGSQGGATSGHQSRGGGRSSRGGKGGERKRQRLDAAAGGAAQTAKASQGATDIQLLRLRKDLDATETAIVNGKQLMSHLEDDVACLTVSVKQMNDMMTKISSRLTPKLVEIYTSGYDPLNSDTSHTRSMTLWTDIKAIKAKVESCRPLVVSQCDKGSSGVDIFNHRSAAIAAGVSIPAGVLLLAMNRDAMKTFDLKMYKTWAAILDLDPDLSALRLSTLEPALLPRRDTQDKEVLLLKSIKDQFDDQEILASAQSKAILKGVLAVLRPDDNVEEVKKLLDAVLHMKSIPQDFSEELQLFKQLLDPWHHIDTVQEAKSKLMNGGKLLNKTVLQFASAGKIVGHVDSVLLQAHRDKGFTTDLTELKKFCGKQELPTSQALTSTTPMTGIVGQTEGGKPTLKDPVILVAHEHAFTKLNMVLASSSTNFKEDKKDEIAEVQKYFKDLLACFDMICDSTFSTKLQEALAQVSAFLQHDGRKGFAMDSDVQALDAASSCCWSPQELSLSKMASDEDLKAFAAKRQASAQAVKVIRSGSVSIADDEGALANSDAKALVAKLQQGTPPQVFDNPGMAGFVVAVKASIKCRLQQGLLQIVQDGKNVHFAKLISGLDVAEVAATDEIAVLDNPNLLDAMQSSPDSIDVSVMAAADHEKQVAIAKDFLEYMDFLKLTDDDSMAIGGRGQKKEEEHEEVEKKDAEKKDAESAKADEEVEKQDAEKKDAESAKADEEGEHEEVEKKDAEFAKADEEGKNVMLSPFIIAALPMLQHAASSLLQLSWVKRTDSEDIDVEMVRDMLMDKLPQIMESIENFTDFCSKILLDSSLKRIGAQLSAALQSVRMFEHGIHFALSQVLAFHAKAKLQQVDTGRKGELFTGGPSRAESLDRLLDKLTPESEDRLQPQLVAIMSSRESKDIYSNFKSWEAVCSVHNLMADSLSDKVVQPMKELLGKEETVKITQDARSICANVTAMLSLYRGLKGEETRQSLIKQARSGFTSRTPKWVQHEMLAALMTRKGGPAAAAAPKAKAAA